MAQPSSTYATNDMAGIREDLADIIYNISPTETPLISMIPQVEATNTLHEWQTDELAAAATNAVIEGDDATTDASSPSVRRNNRTQISDKVARVTGTARAVNTAGRADELDYQMLKRSRELRRDMEKILLNNQAKAAGDDSTARTLAGVPSWIASNIDEAGDATNATGDGSDTRTDGTARAFTETQLKTVLKDVYEAGGDPDILMAGPFNRQVISSFSTNRTNIQRAESNEMNATFEIYISDFGQLKIVPNRFQRPRDVFALQSDMWALAFMPGRNFTTNELAKTGDTDRRQILSEYTLESRQEKANGAVYDLTTS